MEYSLHQRGRASIDFLVELRRRSDRLETSSDRYAEHLGLRNADLPADPEALQQRIAPVMQDCPDFRMLRLMRDWQLNRHGHIAMDAFEEIRAEVEPLLTALDSGPTRIDYADDLSLPAYWDGYEFHRSAGGWDGHEYMGFVHGELIHRHMVGKTFAGAIYELRKRVAAMSPVQSPKKILEMGCASGQYTNALAETYPDAEIWACDLSPRQLEQTRRRANETGAGWKLFQAAAESTGLEDEAFDLVTSYAVFHELPRTVARDVLTESYRLLKPGGCTLVGDVKAYHVQDAWSKWKADFWNQVHGGDPFWREYATSDLASTATEIGFADVAWHGIGDNEDPFVLTARKPEDNNRGK
jgi:SAM-dependent methyltransferase